MVRSLFALVLAITILCTSFALAEDQNYISIIQKQSEQIEELKKRLETLEKTVNSISSKSANPDTVGIKAEGVELGDSKSVAETDKDQYDAALALLKNDKFAEAEENFAKFIEQYPKHNLKENALFWYAETFYRREDFNQAAINYLKSYKEYPRGSKAADTLLKLSLSLGNLNKLKEACTIIEKLETEFPNRSNSSVKRTHEAKLKFLCNKNKHKH